MVHMIGIDIGGTFADAFAAGERGRVAETKTQLTFRSSVLSEAL